MNTPFSNEFAIGFAQVLFIILTKMNTCILKKAQTSENNTANHRPYRDICCFPLQQMYLAYLVCLRQYRSKSKIILTQLNMVWNYHFDTWMSEVLWQCHIDTIKVITVHAATQFNGLFFLHHNEKCGFISFSHL